MSHVHFIGIAGKAMAPLAKMFLDLGWRVTGSDHTKTYPPISTYLQETKISYQEGYSAKNIVNLTDLVVVGRSALLVDPNNPEYLQAKRLGLKILSYPQVLRDYLIKKNSIVIAGTYGKTTISALVSWILEKAGFEPSFMVGGVPLNFSDGIKNTDSPWSVVEGDEPPAMKETDPPKFMFYQPKYIVLTACQWDHPEVFKGEKEYLEAFVKFVKLVPKDGLLVVCSEGKNVKEATKEAVCPVVWYSKELNGADFWVENVRFEKEATRFVVVWRNKTDGSNKTNRLEIESALLGWHNIQNVCGAAALCLSLGIAPRIIREAVKSFQGVKTRLEFMGEFKGVKIFWDFAQHPVKVKETLAALRTRFGKEKIVAVFDPHQTMLQNRESLGWYPGCFNQADEVLIGGVSFSKSVPKENRVTGKDIVMAIKKTQPAVKYFPIEEELIDYLVKNAKSGSIVVFMSSGGQIVPRMIESLRPF